MTREEAHVCPQCGSALTRVHRHLGDRIVGVLQLVHRYRCDDPGCGWEGIVSLPAPGVTPGGASSRRWRLALAWFVVGAALATAATEGLRRFWSDPGAVPAATRDEGAARAARPPLPVPPGTSHDGEPLTAGDPLVLGNPTPLTMRRGCAWGEPGRNPYQGTVADALRAARVPDEVVRKIAAMVEQGLVSDQVQISNEGIRTVSHRRSFDPRAIHMAFGNTMCLDTRVNFAPGHVERADLYETRDADGNPFVIMVPYVCGNVAVLDEREERNGGNGNGNVPEPATLLLMVVGLLALPWFARRAVRAAGRSG